MIPITKGCVWDGDYVPHFIRKFKTIKNTLSTPLKFGVVKNMVSGAIIKIWGSHLRVKVP
jgi:hypothetical protein